MVIASLAKGLRVAAAGAFVTGFLACGSAMAGGAINAGKETWVGEMRQIDRQGEETYRMRLVLEGAEGSTSYPSLSCSGRLSRVGQSGDYMIYRETIVTGRFDTRNGEGCIDGVLTLRQDGARLHLGWYGVYESQATLASATLERD